MKISKIVFISFLVLLVASIIALFTPVGIFSFIIFLPLFALGAVVSGITLKYNLNFWQILILTIFVASIIVEIYGGIWLYSRTRPCAPDAAYGNQIYASAGIAAMVIGGIGLVISIIGFIVLKRSKK